MLPRALTLRVCLLGLFFSLVLVRQAGAADVVVKRFAGGNGGNAVGIVEASQDTEIDGPQALTTDEVRAVCCCTRTSALGGFTYSIAVAADSSARKTWNFRTIAGVSGSSLNHW